MTEAFPALYLTLLPPEHRHQIRETTKSASFNRTYGKIAALAELVLLECPQWLLGN
jgi:hypothetical protein